MVVAIVLIVFALVGGLYAGGIALSVWRALQDQKRAGQLSAHDGRLLALERGRPARDRYAVTRTALPGGATRVTVAGVELAHSMGFRLRGLTQATGAGLEGRLFVEGTRNAGRARRLFSLPEVKDALVTLCGAKARFSGVDLYPGGHLIVDVAGAELDDLEERLLRFLEAIDAAAPRLEGHALPQLAAASAASGAPATFSIEVRS